MREKSREGSTRPMVSTRSANLRSRNVSNLVALSFPRYTRVYVFTYAFMSENPNTDARERSREARERTNEQSSASDRLRNSTRAHTR